MNARQYLKKQKQLASMPTVVKFTRLDGTLASFKAKRGNYVLPIRKVHRYVRLVKEEIFQNILKEKSIGTKLALKLTNIVYRRRK